MGFCVLHYDKQTGSSPGLAMHIERGIERDGVWVPWHPTNADQSRSHLNRELINMPGSRNQRIDNRIRECGIKPKKNAVHALTLIMSASCEDMQRIASEGKLDDWCNASVKWAQETHGTENVVSAVLHMDEKTPHLHVTVVPIVQGESKDQAYRKAKAEKEIQEGKEQKKKRKYKKKDSNEFRLCAADVMARIKLKSYQSSYAQVVGEFGLTRGIDGSEAKHVDINDWYKTLVTDVQELRAEKESLKEDVAELKAIKEDLTKGKEELESVKEDLRLAESKRYSFDRECTANIEKFYEEAGELGLSCQEATQLRKDYEESLKQPCSRPGATLSKPFVTTPDGISIVRDDPQNPNIDIFYGRHNQKMGEPMKLGLWVRFSLGWKPVKVWLQAVKDSPWFRFFNRNGQEISKNRSNSIGIGGR